MSNNPCRRFVSKVSKASSMIAITRELPESFADALSEYSSNEKEGVSIVKARAQHDEYVRVLKRHVREVVQLPALEAFPDSVFVEDTMVANGSKVVLTNPGHASRVGEVVHMERALADLSGVTVVDDMRNTTGATCDGGDVLQMGDTMFVGMSHRTNALGYEVLKAAFPYMNVIQVPAVVQGKTVLHLKSATTNLNERAILVPTGPIGDQVVAALQCNGPAFDVVRLDEVLWCNVVSIQNTVIAQATMNDRSKAVLEQSCTMLDLNLETVDTSELAAKDAALTCCSVLLST